MYVIFLIFFQIILDFYWEWRDRVDDQTIKRANFICIEITVPGRRLFQIGSSNLHHKYLVSQQMEDRMKGQVSALSLDFLTFMFLINGRDWYSKLKKPPEHTEDGIPEC